MNTENQTKPDGAQQKRLLVSMVNDTVASFAGEGIEADDLPLNKAAVAAAAYHYTVGVLRSQEIAGRVKIDPAFAIWRKHGSPTMEDIVRVRDEQAEILLRSVVEALGWSWNVSLRSQVTGMETLAYAEKVVAGRQKEFKSQAEVEAEAVKRIAAAAAADLTE
jgi:hypothetical protein